MEGRVLLRQQFEYVEETQTYVADLSTLRIAPPTTFSFPQGLGTDPETFERSGIDRDSSGEDIWGFRYVCKATGNQALLVND